MLRFFAKFQRSRNFILAAFCTVLFIGLIGFYIPNSPLDPSRGGATSGDNDTVIAKVGSQTITLKEYKSGLDRYAQMLGRGQAFPVAALKQFGLDKEIFDQLIESKISLDQAADLGLTGTNEEISRYVQNMFRDPKTGQFVGVEAYKKRLRENGLNVEEFETQTRDSLTTSKFRDFIQLAAQVSDKDVEDAFKRENTKVDVVYAAIDRDKIAAGFKPTEEELKAYYESHKGNFKATLPTRKVDYLFIPTDAVSKIVPLSDDELRKEYEKKKQPEYRVSAIRLNVLDPKDDSTVNSKINELANKVRTKDVGGQGEDFATVARGNSQDASRAQGGDLGWIKRNPNSKNDWRQRVYTSEMAVNQIDGPFKEGNAWYLIKVAEKRDAPFEDMVSTLKATLSNNKAFSKASEIADRAQKIAADSKDIRKAAAEVAKELSVSPESLIKTTPYFKSGDSLEIGTSTSRSNVPAFDDAVAGLKKGQIGKKVDIPGGPAIPQIVDVIENGNQLSFDQARNQVEEKLRTEKLPNLAKAKADELIGKSNSATDLETNLKAAGFDVKKDTNFNTYNFAGGSGSTSNASMQARAAILGLKEGEVNKFPIKSGISYLVFAATKRVEPDMSTFASEKSSIKQRLITERQNEAFNAFITSTRKRYEKDGKIKIYQDKIDKFFSSLSATSNQEGNRQ